MPVADYATYLADVCAALRAHWPENRTVNVVCHGHSVPAGYFATPYVDTFDAYPHLLHVGLKQRFPYAVANVIVTAIGGESSASGAARFESEGLCHRPDVLTIDYGLNDRGLGLAVARASWLSMIEAALGRGAKVILLTPTPDVTQLPEGATAERAPLQEHAAQIRELAAAYGLGLADSLAECEAYVAQPGHHLTDLLSWCNHPNRAGHELVARALLRYFPAANGLP